MNIQFTLKGRQTRDPLARVGRPDVGVREGDTVAAVIQNNAERDVYVTILDLSSDGTMSVVYPAEQGAKDVLKPGFNVLEIVRHIRPKVTDGSDQHSEGFREL